MTAFHYPMFVKYTDAVRRYEGDASAAGLRMASARRVSVYYSPFACTYKGRTSSQLGSKSCPFLRTMMPALKDERVATQQ